MLEMRMLLQTHIFTTSVLNVSYVEHKLVAWTEPSQNGYIVSSSANPLCIYIASIAYNKRHILRYLSLYELLEWKQPYVWSCFHQKPAGQQKEMRGERVPSDVPRPPEVTSISLNLCKSHNERSFSKVRCLLNKLKKLSHNLFQKAKSNHFHLACSGSFEEEDKRLKGLALVTNLQPPTEILCKLFTIQTYCQCLLPFHGFQVIFELVFVHILHFLPIKCWLVWGK